MNKKNLFLLLSLFLIIGSINVFGVDNLFNTSILRVYYSYEFNSSSQVDSSGNNNYSTLTSFNSGLKYTTGKLGNGFISNATAGIGKQVLNTTMSFSSQSFSVWFKPHSFTDAGGNTKFLLGKSSDANTYIYYNQTAFIIQGAGGGVKYFQVPTMTLENWYHLIVTQSGANTRVYLNGTESSSGLQNVGSALSYDQLLCYLDCGLVSYVPNATIDEYGIWNKTLNATEVLFLYNNGSAYSPYFSSNFSVIAKKVWDNSSINSFNLTMQNGATTYNFGTNTGTITTNLLSNNTLLWNLTFSNSSFFNSTYYNINLSFGNYVGYLNQSIINFSLKEFDNNISLSNFSLNITGYGVACNTTESSCLIYPNNGTYTYSLIDNTGINFYTPINNSFNVNVLDNKTVISYVTEHWINVTAKNIRTNASINSFSVNLTDLTDSTDVRDFSTTSGYVLIPVIHHSYNISIDASSFVLSSANVTVNTSITANSVINQTFYLYDSNSLDIYLFNESNSASLNGTSVITLINDGTLQYTNVSTTGHVYFNNLSVNTHTLTFFASGFENKYYIIDVASRSHSSLNIYLLPSTSNTVVFTIKDSDTGQTLESVSVVVSRWINNTKIDVENYISDVTGKFTQSYSDGIRYDYNLTKATYTDKTFTLNPISSATYSVLMDKSISYTSDVDYSNVQIYWSPKQFSENSNPNISFIFNDPNSVLEYYGFNATFQSNSISMSGTNPDGETLMDNISIGDSGVLDYITINYWYKKTSGDRHDFSVRYFVYNSSSLTWANNYDTTWGLGVFDRTLIAVCIIIVLAGSGAMFLGGTGAGVMAIVGIGLCVKLGLMNPYLAYPSMIILILIVGWRASI